CQLGVQFTAHSTGINARLALEFDPPVAQPFPLSESNDVSEKVETGVKVVLCKDFVCHLMPLNTFDFIKNPDFGFPAFVGFSELLEIDTRY
ncbi:MAG: hypothetical protein ACOYN2_07000, partial [Patescibacteria group bacterium]